MSTRDDGDGVASFARVREEFEAAWRHPNYTQFELPALDVNKVLSERYSVNPAIRLTRAMLWDMERKKAWDPMSYIPYVVSSGRSWGRHHLEDGCERFFRSSIQIGWISQERGQVLEEVFISHKERRIFFLGRPEMIDEERECIYAEGYQPLFHVEHAAGGSESEPLNIWRIVFLTENKDRRFTRPFQQMIKAALLPGFLEIYIERDLGATLRRR
jgi:hypothetical protein